MIMLLIKLMDSTIITKRQLFGYFVLYAGVVFWFFSAPDVRFGYGFLVGASVFVFSLILLVLIRKVEPSIKFVKYAVFLGLLLFQGYTFSYSLDLATLKERIIFPFDYSRSRAELCDIKNATVYCRVEGGQCDYDKFPCIPSPRPNVEMRGPTFQDGFRTSP